MILIVKHIDIEGPGTLGDFLRAHGEPFEIIELGAGEKLPVEPQKFKAVVVLGGPMNVDEENRFSFLKPENDFIQEVLKREVPFLGICLGSQLLAKAAGARVVRSPVKEIGWYKINLTAEGKKDPLFNGFCENDPIYHWHGDMFQIPLNGQLLASAKGCPHQALKVGKNAYGLQFHVEVTDKSIKEWCEEYCSTDLPGRESHAKSMMDDYWKHKAAFDAQAQRLYHNFLGIINEAKHPSVCLDAVSMLKITLAQINPTVGDLAGNTRKILEYTAQAQKAGAELVVFPELAICGYPPEDLLLKKHFVADNIKALDALAKKIRQVSVITGFVDSDAGGKIYNAAALISDGKVQDVYYKQELPNYGVFDEKRYFSRGQNSGVWTVNGFKIGINICEDIWIDGAVYRHQASAGAKILINISSSPYHAGKLKERQELLNARAKEIKIPLAYVNSVGGQDELVFDGGSMVVSPSGDVLARALQFEEALLNVDFSNRNNPIASVLESSEEIYKALVLGTRDYAAKNGFKKVALGLSGGVDSALVACIACDAFGPENVTAISMPSAFNSKATRQDARQLAKNLKMELKEIPIKKIFAAYLKTLAPYFTGLPSGIAEENIQARIRGNILMAMANKFGGLILTTGNKSEMAVGYCTLYGDMSGGYAVIKDVFKTKVYELARFRNNISREALIPKNILLRAPSAELKFNQTDEETLGAYEDLDKILTAYIENHSSLQDMVAAGMDEKMVSRTIRLVDMNEYKRRQAPPGVKITSCAFGKDWRLPITNRFKE